MKHTIMFLLVRQKDNNKDGRLRCRVVFDHQRVEFNLGYRINIDGWNADTQRCKRCSMHGRNTGQKINAEIERYDRLITDVFDTSDTVTADMLRTILRTETTKPPVVCVSSAVKDFIEEEKQRWSEGTVKKFRTLCRHVQDFKMDIDVEAVDTAWMSRYSKRLSADLNNSSVNKELKNMRWFLKWCIGKGMDVSKEASEWAPRLKTTPRRVIFLEWDELMRVYDHDFRNLHLAEVRDCFCFCCFTGLRFSDVYALKRADIHRDFMAVTTIKNGELIEIPLNKYAKAILDRYREDDLKGKALPVCNNSEMNETLKDVMKECGLDSEVTLTEYRGNKRVEKTCSKWQAMTTHCGRRTFVCNALMMGVSAEVVMSITGHSSYSSMKPYIAVADSAKKAAMDLFDQKG